MPRQCRGNGSVGLCSSAQHSDEPQAARPLERPKIHVIQRSRVLLFNTTQGEKENHDALLQPPKLRSLFYPPPSHDGIEHTRVLHQDTAIPGARLVLLLSGASDS